MAYRGYHFFIGDLELPYAPSKLKVTIGSKNQTVDLINGGEINILKSPALTEIEFDVELPRGRQYAFANQLVSSKKYTDYFEKLMLKKTPVKLVITRPNPQVKGQGFSSTSKIIRGGTSKDFESTVLTVSLEGYSLEESADNAFDVTASLSFKEYVKYGTIKKTVTTKTNTKKKSKPVSKPKNPTTNKTHDVKPGDNLWKIARKYYGTANQTLVNKIYNHNKTVIEKTAKKHGKKDSNKGWWIYPKTKLIIPGVKK